MIRSGLGRAVPFAATCAAACAALAQAPGGGAGLSIDSREFALNDRLHVFRVDRYGDGAGAVDLVASQHEDGAGLASGTRYFGRVASGAAEDAALRYAVEALPDSSAFQLCQRILGSGTEADQAVIREPCLDVQVGVREGSGLLYLYWDTPIDPERNWRYSIEHNLNDWPTQRMELSVAEPGSGQRAHRDVLVRRPATAPDCADFPERDVDRYLCLFNREIAARPGAAPAAVVSALPAALVQPRENYRLAFEEEFNGRADAADSCGNGLSQLDSAVWNYREDSCGLTAGDGTLCARVEDGRFIYGASPRCQYGGISTTGKFAYQYGYLESRYTIDLDIRDPSFRNVAFVVGHPTHPRRYGWRQYGVVPASYRDMALFHETEIDFYEVFAAAGTDQANRYFNFWPVVLSRGVEPRRSQHVLTFCGQRQTVWTHDLTVDGCREVTLVKGLEWTPGGYRMHVKVEGLHDDFIVVPQSKVRLRHKEPEVVNPGGDELAHAGGVFGLSNGAIGFPGDWLDHDEAAREPFFGATGDGGYLERYAVAHMPLALFLYAWGDEHYASPYLGGTVSVDYIRVFQPQDGYASMEPAFE